MEEFTPNALYDACIVVIAGFPEDASLWSITLSSSVFSALSPNLQDKIEEKDTFQMPSISEMYLKTKQLEGLRTVKLAAVTAYKKLNDESERMRKILFKLGKSRYEKHHQLEVRERYN